MLNSKHSSSILVGLLAVALLCACYFYIILPKQDEASSLQQSVAILEQDIISLQTAIESQQATQEHTIENLFAQQKKLPLHKDIVTLLLNIEEVEMVSQTNIVSILFNNYDAVVSESMLQDPNQPFLNEALKVMEELEEEGPISPIAKDMLPSQLRMVTFNIDIESASEKDISTFIKELESLERIVRIDRIAFALPGEASTYDEAASRLATAKVQVTAFYFEE